MTAPQALRVQQPKLTLFNITCMDCCFCCHSCYLDGLAETSEVLHASDLVLAVRYILAGGLDLVLKLTLEERANFEAAQVGSQDPGTRVQPGKKP